MTNKINYNKLSSIFPYMPVDVSKEIEQLWSKGANYYYDNNFSQINHNKTFITTWIKWTASTLKLTSNLKHEYITNGSSEALREYIWSLKKQNKRLLIFKGDDPRYIKYAINSGIEYEYIDRSHYSSFHYHKNDTVLYSNPSYIDGNIWEKAEHFQTMLFKKSVHITTLVDTALLGCSFNKKDQIKLNFSNIEAVFFSLANSFGIINFRLGGVLSTRPIDGLNEDFYFKNSFTINLAMHLMQQFPVNHFAKKFKTKVKQIQQKLHKEQLFLKTTDVWFILIDSAHKKYCISSLIKESKPKTKLNLYIAL